MAISSRLGATGRPLILSLALDGEDSITLTIGAKLGHDLLKMPKKDAMVTES